MTTPRSWFAYGIRLFKDLGTELQEDHTKIQEELNTAVLKQAKLLGYRGKTLGGAVDFLGIAASDVVEPFRARAGVSRDKYNTESSIVQRQLAALAPYVPMKQSKSPRLWKSIEARPWLKLAGELDVHPAHLAAAQAAILVAHAEHHGVVASAAKIGGYGLDSKRSLKNFSVERVHVNVFLAEKLDVMILEHRPGFHQEEYNKICDEWGVPHDFTRRK